MFNNKINLVVIGISTGGPKALIPVLERIPADSNAAYVVLQHIPEGFTKNLAERLNKKVPLNVVEAKDNDILKVGSLYIAKGGCQLRLQDFNNSYKIELNSDYYHSIHRPSIDYTLTTLSNCRIGKLMVVIMTGMGADGTEGVKHLRACKSFDVIAQDEATSKVFGMPKSIITNDLHDYILPLDSIADKIIDYLEE